MSSPVGITNEGRAGISIEGRTVSLNPQPSAVTVPVITNPGVVVLPPVGAAPQVAPEEEQIEQREGEAARPFEFGAGNARTLTRYGAMTFPLGSSVRVRIQPAQPAVHTYNNDDMRRLETSTQAHISIVGRK
jgi:hypothetical protein